MSLDHDEKKKKAIERFDDSWSYIMSSKLTKQELAESYDSIVDIYNLVCPVESILSIVEAFMKLDLPKDIRIMDMCCGTGRLAQLLNERGYTNIDGLDCSDKSLDMARETGCFKNLYKEIFYANKNESLKDETYDLVFVCNAFQPNHLSSAHFNELTRIIKKGGHFAFKIRDIYTQMNELKVFEDDVEKFVREKKWKPAIDMFKKEPKPGHTGTGGQRYISLHYIMQILV